MLDATAYSNKDDTPYIFISYSHRDSKRVLPAIEIMQQNGYRVWFDSGIEAGTEWSNNIATHLRDCSAFIAFISSNSVLSENCLDEIAYAKSYRKPSLMIYLEEDVPLPQGTEMQTARFQRMYYSRQTSLEAFAQNLRTSPIFDHCIENPTRDKPDLYPESSKANMSNKKLILIMGSIFITIALLILIVLCALLLKTEKNSNTVETIPSAATVPAEITEELKMSDNLDDYIFTLDGVIYQLPFAFSQLEDNGWTITSSGYSSSTKIAGMGKEYFSMVKDGKKIDVIAYNDTGNLLSIGSSRVGGIEIHIDSNTDFTIAKNITTTSTKEEIIAAFGTPSKRNTQSDYESLFYGQEQYSSTGVTFHCYTPDSDMYEYSSIELNNFIYQAVTETNEAIPAYLAEYIAPTALGDDLFSGIIQIEGELYQIPAPINTFLDNGWEFSSCPAYVVAGGEESITLARDGKTLNIEAANFAEYQTIPENCIVTHLSIYESDFVSSELPLGITGTMTLNELEDIVPDVMDRTDGLYSTGFYYYEYDPRDFTLSFSVDIESGIMDYIKLSCTTFAYE